MACRAYTHIPHPPVGIRDSIVLGLAEDECRGTGPAVNGAIRRDFLWTTPTGVGGLAFKTSIFGSIDVPSWPHEDANDTVHPLGRLVIPAHSRAFNY